MKPRRRAFTLTESRTVLELKNIGYKPAEISRETGVTRSQVEKILQQMRELKSKA